MWLPDHAHPTSQAFAGLAEHTFVDELGVADPPLIDYIANLLARFLHADAIHRLRDTAGRPLEEVADMLAEARQLPAGGRTRREYHRHIGDFTLFWTGLFPESLEKKRTALCKDRFLDYRAHGKRAYYLASTYADDELADEAKVLRRLSEQFELCAYGLRQMRREWM